MKGISSNDFFYVIEQSSQGNCDACPDLIADRCKELLQDGCLCAEIIRLRNDMSNPLLGLFPGQIITVKDPYNVLGNRTVPPSPRVEDYEKVAFVDWLLTAGESGSPDCSTCPQNWGEDRPEDTLYPSSVCEYTDDPEMSCPYLISNLRVWVEWYRKEHPVDVIEGFDSGLKSQNTEPKIPHTYDPEVDCSKCEGVGYTLIHDNDYENGEFFRCSECKGTGRKRKR